jgi:aryl-alcohol dehydrogenase-like predicted oxidoreductase
MSYFAKWRWPGSFAGIDDIYSASTGSPGRIWEGWVGLSQFATCRLEIRNIGLCEVSSATLRRACQIAHVAAVQIEYSPFVGDIEGKSGTNLLAACRELSVAIVCYAPFGRGLLTGTLTSKESVTGAGDARGTHMPRFNEENLAGNIKIMNQFKPFAGKKGCSMSQLALAWLVKQGNDIIPIPGTTKIRYLEET